MVSTILHINKIIVNKQFYIIKWLNKSLLSSALWTKPTVRNTIINIWIGGWASLTPTHVKSTSWSVKSVIKYKNNMLLNVPFHSYPSQNHTDRHPDASACTLVAPCTLHICSKFKLIIPSKSKVPLILSNSLDHSLPGLKCSAEC